MVKHGLLPAFSLSATGLCMAGVAGFLLLGPAATAVASAPSPSVQTSEVAKPKTAPLASDAKPAGEARESLGEGFIAQNVLRVYLSRPAVLTLHNAQGQLVFHLESARPMEAIPLSGVPTGFLYLTLRSGNLEMTKKLVYSGK